MPLRTQKVLEMEAVGKKKYARVAMLRKISREEWDEFVKDLPESSKLLKATSKPEVTYALLAISQEMPAVGITTSIASEEFSVCPYDIRREESVASIKFIFGGYGFASVYTKELVASYKQEGEIPRFAAVHSIEPGIHCHFNTHFRDDTIDLLGYDSCFTICNNTQLTRSEENSVFQNIVEYGLNNALPCVNLHVARGICFSSDPSFTQHNSLSNVQHGIHKMSFPEYVKHENKLLFHFTDFK
jgi:hypothetical protein